MKLITDEGETLDVRTVTVQPGDVIVVDYPVHLSGGTEEYIRDNIKQFFPDSQVVILTGGVDLAIVRKRALGLKSV